MYPFAPFASAIMCLKNAIRDCRVVGSGMMPERPQFRPYLLFIHSVDYVVSMALAPKDQLGVFGALPYHDGE